MVTLDEYSFRGLGHNGVVDDYFHHSRATLEYVVGVSEQGEEAHKDSKWISHAMMIDAMITRDGTSTWILWELRQPPCHIIDEPSSDNFAGQHVG
jgi:hypothetical protein